MTATSNLKQSKTTEKRVSELTLKLKTHWKKSTEAVLETGKCLHELKQLLPRKDFIAHVKKEIGISEKHAMRIIAVYLKFGKSKCEQLLNSKPTILYQLAYVCTDSQLGAIIKGQAIQTASGKKSLPQLKVGDLIRHKKIDHSREIATFLEETQDEISRFEKIIVNRKILSNRMTLKESVTETMKCLRNFNQKL